MQFSCPDWRSWREMGLLCSLLTVFWAEQMYWASSVREAQWKRRSAELCKGTSWFWASLDQLYFTLVPLSVRQCRRTACPWHVTTGEPSNQTWGLLTASKIQISIKKLDFKTRGVSIYNFLRPGTCFWCSSVPILILKWGTYLVSINQGITDHFDFKWSASGWHHGAVVSIVRTSKKVLGSNLPAD